jgi:hypothetical protein
MVYLYYGLKHKPLKVNSTEEVKKIKTCTYKRPMKILEERDEGKMFTSCYARLNETSTYKTSLMKRSCRNIIVPFNSPT